MAKKASGLSSGAAPASSGGALDEATKSAFVEAVLDASRPVGPSKLSISLVRGKERFSDLIVAHDIMSATKAISDLLPQGWRPDNSAQIRVNA